MPRKETPSVEGVAARRATLQMLHAVLRLGLKLDSAAAARSLSGSDPALAVAIAGEVLRRIPDLDALIDSATKRPLPDDSKARMVLRMALAQKIALNTPDHAIVATALPLVDGGPRKLVHGVLGTLLRRGVPKSGTLLLPADVEKRWSRMWGECVVMAARRAIVARPPLDLIFKKQESADGFARFVGGVQLTEKHVRLAAAGPVERLPGYDTGEWWVQNLAASLPARLIPEAAKTVLDACSAPGGKTLQLAAAGHSVISVDASESRLPLLEQNLGRTRLSAEVVFADLLEWKGPRSFDAILLDAPCSSTGTFRRHPDVLYRARGSVISEMADRQLQLLMKARDWLRLGGVLVYSVCSLEANEGEAVLDSFLAGNPDFRIDPPQIGELPDFIPISPEGWVRILPGLLESEGGLDGFFIARLVRGA